MSWSRSKDLLTSPGAITKPSIPFSPAPAVLKLVTVLVAAMLILAASTLLPNEIWTGLANTGLANTGLADKGYFRSDLLGFISLTCIYVLAILLMAPLSPFALAAGLLFGFWWGTLLALIALNVGAALAFFIARHLLPREFARQLCRGKTAAVAEALRGEAVATIAVLRLNPLVPFNLQNYLCGLTGVSFARYALATLLGGSPFTVALVYLGHAGRQLASASGVQVEQWILLLSFLAVVVTVPLTWAVLRRVVKHLRECHKNDKVATQED